MKGRFVYVYRRGGCPDCTGNGITYKNDRLILLWGGTRQEAVKYATEQGHDLDKCLYLVNRELWGEDHSYATPLIEPRGINMFGGNYVMGDSTCYHFRGEMCVRPIPVHDRYESQKEYDGLSI